MTYALASAVLIGSLSGCSSIIPEDVTKYPMVSGLTNQEIMDYYAKQTSFDSIVTKDVVVHEANYETYPITGDKEQKLKDMTGQAEALLGNMEYEYTEENESVLTPDSFHYIKSYLNDKKIDKGEIKSVEGALGYYFVTVEYPLSARGTGTFTQKTAYLGVNGAFVEDMFGEDSIDMGFLRNAADKLNKYYEENRINTVATLDEGSGIITFGEGNGDSELPPMNNSPEQPENPDSAGDENPDEMEAPGDDEEDADTSDTELDEQETNEDGETVEGEGETEPEEDIPVNPVNIENQVVTQRTPMLDASWFNSIVGSSKTHSAYMPALEQVYNIPENEGYIGGIGINSIGDNGLKTFNFDRNAISGTLKLVYVFKDTVDGSGNIVATNVYPTEMNINTGINSASNSVSIPEFLQTEFEKILERADRATLNIDLPALTSGHIYENVGYGVLRGYENDHVNLLKQMSTIRTVIARSNTTNEYLLEVETVKQEGARDVDCYGTYREKSFVTIKQVDNYFLITDWFTYTRQVQKEPEINPDSATEKRIVALGLSGEVSDDSKKHVNELLSDLYRASTARKLNGPYTVGDKEYERGMYDCFNSDPSMLSSESKEYMNSALRNRLLKYGTNVESEYKGIVTSWIGGADNQVELMTEELITYQGRSDALYMRVYYLVSNMEDRWVIDEMTVIEEDELSGAELDNAASRINK